MAYSAIFSLISLAVGICMVALLYRKGTAALAAFPDLQNDRVVFRDRYASGYAHKGLMTRISGVNVVHRYHISADHRWCNTLPEHGLQDSDK